MSKIKPQELFVLYSLKRETFKKYVVNKDTIGKVLDLETNTVSGIKIKKGVKLSKVKIVKRRPDVLELKDDEHPNLRFYILGRRLNWINKVEVEDKIKEYLKELKKENE